MLIDIDIDLKGETVPKQKDFEFEFSYFNTHDVLRIKNDNKLNECRGEPNK